MLECKGKILECKDEIPWKKNPSSFIHLCEKVHSAVHAKFSKKKIRMTSINFHK